MTKVVELPTDAALLRRSVGDCVQVIVDAHAAGRIGEMVVVFTDSNGDSFSLVSKSTQISNLAYAIALLQHRLIAWMDRL